LKLFEPDLFYLALFLNEGKSCSITRMISWAFIPLLLVFCIHIFKLVPLAGGFKLTSKVKNTSAFATYLDCLFLTTIFLLLDLFWEKTSPIYFGLSVFIVFCCDFEIVWILLFFTVLLAMALFWEKILWNWVEGVLVKSLDGVVLFSVFWIFKVFDFVGEFFLVISFLLPVSLRFFEISFLDVFVFIELDWGRGYECGKRGGKVPWLLRVKKGLLVSPNELLRLSIETFSKKKIGGSLATTWGWTVFYFLTTLFNYVGKGSGNWVYSR
jgi:hypothetical protein